MWSGIARVIGLQEPDQLNLTVVAEKLMIGVVPAGILLLATPFYLKTVVRNPRRVHSGPLLLAKLSAGSVLLCVQMANVLLWHKAALFPSDVAFSAAIMSFVASLCTLFLIYISHAYSLQPSVFLSVYLSITMAFDFLMVRFYFLQVGLGLLGFLQLFVALNKLLLLAFEEMPKRGLIDTEKMPSAIAPEEISGFWNRAFFIWLQPTLALGFREAFSIEDLPTIDEELNPEKLHAVFSHYWIPADKTSEFALLKSLVYTIPGQFVSVILPRLLHILFHFTLPFVSLYVVDYVSRGEYDRDASHNLITATIVSFMGYSVTGVIYEHLVYRILTSIHGVLIVAIHEKMYKLDMDELEKMTAISLMNADTNGVKKMIRLVFDSWASFIQVAVGLFALWQFVDVACFLMLVPGLVSFTGSILVGKHMSQAAIAWDEQKHARVSATSNVLAQIKNVKAVGLSGVMADLLKEKRRAEIEISMMDRHGRLWMFAFSAFNMTVTPAVILGAAYFWTRASEGLKVAEVFTIIAITTIASQPLIHLLERIMQWSHESAAIARIQRFLLLQEIEEQRLWDLTPPQSPNSFRGIEDVGPAPQPRYAAFAVDILFMSVTSLGLGPVLRDIDLQIPWGALVLLWGPIGCGKSTFLKTIIGEAVLNTGSVTLGSNSVAFCSQECWIQNLSVRSNITGALEFIANWYSTVIFCCALDLDLAQLPNGDFTMTGSRGCNLSGGQKKRLSLARAVYARKDIIVLDDIFSSLDPDTASVIFDRLFGAEGLVRQWNCTVIMTTNRLEFLDHATIALEMLPDGRIRVSAGSEPSTRAATPQGAVAENTGGVPAAVSSPGVGNRFGDRLESPIANSSSSGIVANNDYHNASRPRNPFAVTGSTGGIPAGVASPGVGNRFGDRLASPIANSSSTGIMANNSYYNTSRPRNPFAVTSNTGGMPATVSSHGVSNSFGDRLENPIANNVATGIMANNDYHNASRPRNPFAVTATNSLSRSVAASRAGSVAGSFAHDRADSVASSSVADDADFISQASQNREASLAGSDDSSDDSSDTSTEHGNTEGLPIVEAEPSEPPSVKAISSDDRELIEAKEQRGAGDLSLYSYFLRSAGFCTVALWVFAAAISAVVEKMPVIFIHIWYDRDPQNYHYYMGYVAFAIANVVFTTASGAQYLKLIVPKISEDLHSQLLHSVLGAAADFLNNTDSGELLSRFSRDVAIVSTMLPLHFMQAVFMTFTVLSEIVIIAYGSPYISPVVLFLVVVIYVLQHYYLRTARQLRILELEANASLITHFTETANGMDHIRALKWESYFTSKLYATLSRWQKPYYYMFCSERSLSLALDLASTVAATLLVILSTLSPKSTSDTTIGLAFQSLLTFSTTASFSVRCWTHVETSLGAVARIRSFCQTTPQEQDTLSGPPLASTWPRFGRIDFNGLTASYRTKDGTTHEALQQVTTTLLPGQKVGIEGRTGSGKSTLIQAIVRLMEFSGSVSIDGRNVKSIPREFLRSRITTLTQDGVELQGTLRFNLYPFKGLQPTESLIISTLQQVGLWTHVVANGGVDANIVCMRFSVGQKQLLFLARAILHHSVMNTSIVLIDEATSSMDYHFDDSAQQLMDQEFAGCTVLLIAHRPDAFDNADAIIRLDGGTVTGIERRGRHGEWVLGH